MDYPTQRPEQHGRSSWDPFGELASVRAELNRMVGSVLGGLYGDRGWLSDVDLAQSEDGWTVTARLPGVAPEEVLIELDERELCVRARTAEDDEGTGASVRRGFSYRVVLPGEVDGDGVDATMDHGLLTVRLPRATRSRRREVAVGRASVPSATAAGSAPADSVSGGVGDTGYLPEQARTHDDSPEPSVIPPIAAQEGQATGPDTTLVDMVEQPEQQTDPDTAGSGERDEASGSDGSPRPSTVD